MAKLQAIIISVIIIPDQVLPSLLISSLCTQYKLIIPIIAPLIANNRIVTISKSASTLEKLCKCIRSVKI
jgi:hypothetical protein